MELPNYFLADMPPEATVTPALVTEACQTLKRNRERYLAQRSTQNIINLLSSVAKEWLEPSNTFRRRALEQGPALTGFPPGTLAKGLDNLFKQLTPAALSNLIEQDLGAAQRFEGFVSTPVEQKASRAAIATGPDLIAHFTAGNLPNPTVVGIILGWLARSAQFVKCATGASFLPRLFAHSVYTVDPKLASCLEIAEWKGGNAPVEEALFAEADCVTATGSDETLAAIRSRLPVRTRFLGYGDRVSFSYVSSSVLTTWNAKKIARRAATDVAAWNQLGCLSPHLIYVEHGGEVTAEQFAELLADELISVEETDPRGELPAESAAAIASRRSLYVLRASVAPDTRIWASEQSTAWTVVYDADPRFQFSCLNRFIYVKGVQNLDEMLAAADSARGKTSTIGIAVPPERAEPVAMRLARWGATRVCPLGQMQDPPLPWRHDGRPALADLLTWTDWETGSPGD